jgi:integrase
MTFDECAAAYVKAHAAGWRSKTHAAQWANTLRAIASPVFGNLPVAAVDTGLVMQALEPAWSEKTETASRTRGRIESVLDWAKVRGYRTGDNPARWRGHLDHLLPARSKMRKVKHHAALPHAELPAFMAELRGREGMCARAIELIILTALRRGEALNAQWDEIDLPAKVWTIPAGRTKAGREHRVPLSGRAVEILQALPREHGNPFVFIGARSGRPLSGRAVINDVPRALTVHGFRSTFRDWCAERTNFPREVAEAALAHVVGDKVEAAYRRADLLEKRRQLMDAWSRYCTSPPAGGEVVPLRKGRAR